jgi:methionine-rich copper-binding protein CopC
MRTGRLASLVLVAVLSLALLSDPGRAQGHGIVIESTPRHEETVAAPKKLVIRFNSRLEKRLCSVTLVGPQQNSVLLVRQDTDAPPDTLIYPLPPDLKPGAYRAKWKVLAADGHVTEGAIAFTVQSAAPAR